MLPKLSPCFTAAATMLLLGSADSLASAAQVFDDRSVFDAAVAASQGNVQFEFEFEDWDGLSSPNGSLGILADTIPPWLGFFTGTALDTGDAISGVGTNLAWIASAGDVFGIQTGLTFGNASPVEFWYDFEGDAGGVAKDKLIFDGIQDGILEGNASIQSQDVLFGSQSAAFEIPDSDPPPFSTLQVPGSTVLGEDFTLAAHVENREGVPDFTRVFSSFRGTGVVGIDRILLDFDPTGVAIPGLRAFVNGTAVQTASVPTGLSSPGYHHFALTVDSGDLRIYFDGAEVAAGDVGLGYSNAVDIHVGEDPHDGGGTANEQLIGNVDEVLVISRALSASEILSLTTATVSNVVTPSVGEYAVYYDFEGDLTDQFSLDGRQDAIPLVNAGLDNTPENAAFGAGSGQLQLPNPNVLSRIEVGRVGNLGDRFTISVTVDFPQAGYAAGGLTRLFSTHPGTGSAAGDLIFDFDPAASVEDIGVRLLLPDGSQIISPTPSSLNVRHTFTATYEAGDVRLYLDGAQIGTTSTVAVVDLGPKLLYIGEDSGGVINENFIGTLDDAFIIARALSAQEVLAVHQAGAARVIPEPSKLLLFVSGLLTLHALGRARAR